MESKEEAIKQIKEILNRIEQQHGSIRCDNFGLGFQPTIKELCERIDGLLWILENF